MNKRTTNKKNTNKKMRLFIALPLPDEIKNYLINVQQRIVQALQGKINLVKEFHLTLKFLGEVDEKTREKIKSSLQNIKVKPFHLQLNSLGFFPNENYIRVVWIGLKPAGKIIELQQQIDNSLKDFFPRDTRFEPHLTLGRVKFIKNKTEFKKQIAETKIEPKKLRIEKFQLIKSELTPNGPLYEIIEEF